MHSRGGDLVAARGDPELRPGLASDRLLGLRVVARDQRERRAVDGREPDLGRLTDLLDHPGQGDQRGPRLVDAAELAQRQIGHEVGVRDALPVPQWLGDREHLAGDRLPFVRVLRPPGRPEPAGRARRLVLRDRRAAERCRWPRGSAASLSFRRSGELRHAHGETRHEARPQRLVLPAEQHQGVLQQRDQARRHCPAAPTGGGHRSRGRSGPGAVRHLCGARSPRPRGRWSVRRPGRRSASGRRRARAASRSGRGRPSWRRGPSR